MKHLRHVSFGVDLRPAAFRATGSVEASKAVLAIVMLLVALLSAVCLSAQTPPQDGWKGVDLWVGGSADDLSAKWPGAMVTVLGRGPDGGVRSLAKSVAGRAAAFDALVGLRGPMRPLLILWIEDGEVATEYGGAGGWVRQLELTDPDADALGGDVWVVAGDAESLGPKVAQAVDRLQVSRRGLGLPDFLQVALLDLLSTVTVESPAADSSTTTARVGLIDAYLKALEDMKDWQSFVGASLTPWASIPTEMRTALRPQGWAFLHYFLLERENGAAELQQALAISRAGAVFPAALQEVLVRPPDKLVEKVVRPYARKGDLERVDATWALALPELWPFEPEFDRVLVELGRVQDLRDRPDDARALFTRAESLAGTSAARAAAGLAFDARRRENHEMAAEAFGRAAAADPVNAHWPREQARSILARTGGEPDDASTDRAIALLRTSLDLDPTLSETWTQLGVAFKRRTTLGADDAEWVEAKYRSAPEERQGDVAVALYAVYESQGRRRDAESLAQRHTELLQLPIFYDSGAVAMPEVQAGNTPISVEGAMELMRQERYEEALTAFEALRVRSQGSGTWSAGLEEQIESLRTVVAHNRFVAAYNQAAELFNERRFRDAANVLEPVVGDVRDEARREKGEKLLAQSLEWADKTGQ